MQEQMASSMCGPLRGPSVTWILRVMGGQIILPTRREDHAFNNDLPTASSFHFTWNERRRIDELSYLKVDSRRQDCQACRASSLLLMRISLWQVRYILTLETTQPSDKEGAPHGMCSSFCAERKVELQVCHLLS